MKRLAKANPADIAKHLKNLQRKGAPLAPEEWDFGKCPDEELDYCCFYEYARESEIARELAALSRSSVPAEASGSGDGKFDEWCDKAMLKGVSRIALGIVARCPEFPKTPWLAIPPAKRKARIFRASELTSASPGIREIGLDDASLPSRLRGLRIRIETRKYTPEIELIHPRPQDDFLFHIDLDLPIKSLTAGFKNWVQEKKQALAEQFSTKAKLQPEFPKRKNPKDGRGKGCESSAWLRRLAAWRIFRISDLTLDQACHYFHGVYTDPADWSTFSREAQARALELFPPIPVTTSKPQPEPPQPEPEPQPVLDKFIGFEWKCLTCGHEFPMNAQEDEINAHIQTFHRVPDGARPTFRTTIINGVRVDDSHDFTFSGDGWNAVIRKKRTFERV